jgi:hypothetical protein
VLAFGCAGAPPAPKRATTPAASQDAGAADAAPDADTLPPLDAVAARAAAATHGMREVARAEVTGPRASSEIVRADARDACVRVAYVASAPVHARIEDAGGAVLAERAPDTDGLLGARGPVCVRRGSAVRVTFEGATDAKVRFVAWAAP